MKKILSFILVLSMVLAFAAGCTQTSNETAGTTTDTATEAATGTDTGAVTEPAVTYKDTLVIATYKEPATLDPMESNKPDIMFVGMNIFDPLVICNSETGEVAPMLAKSWEYLDDTTIRFHLRDDVTFHDGGKFTAEDVLFSFVRAKDNPISYSTFQACDLDNSVIVDDYTFDLKLFYPYAPIFSMLSGGRSGIASKAAVERLGDAEYARNPVGTGPYVMEEWVTGTEITLVRNDNYWGAMGQTEKLVFKVIPEASSRVIALETGEVDLAYSINGSDVNRVNDIDGVHAEIAPSTRYTLLTMNMQDEMLSNKDLRYAISCAIDRESLVNAIYGDTATVATGYMPELVSGWKDVGEFTYDPDLAKEYLVKAGYPDGVTLDFLIDGTDEFKNVAEILQNMWKAVGINVNISTNASVAAYLSEGNHIQLAIRSGSANEASGCLIIYDSTFGDRMQANSDWLDEQLANATTILDVTEHAAAYGEIADWLYEERYSVPIAYTSSIFGASDKLEGWTLNWFLYPDLTQLKIAE